MASHHQPHGMLAMSDKVPSFMRPTASMANKLAQRDEHDEREADVDLAKLVSRQPGTGFSVGAGKNTASKPAHRHTTSATFANQIPAGTGPAHGWRSRPAAEQETDPLPDSWDRVRVFVRVRPCLGDGETPGALTLDPADPQRLVAHRHEALLPEARFQFDRVLGPQCSQQDVYNEAIRPIVEDVLLGYNGTVMAYGQTGAGKTYTLANLDPAHVGMMPRAMADIFNHATVDALNIYKVYVSYVQIYLETIKDLLMPSAEKLDVREDTNGVFLSNVHEEEVKNTQECLKLLQRGDANRVVAATEMNMHSSRSHAIVIVTVYKQRRRAQARVNENGEEVVGRQTTMGRMFLVDLAGSERLKKSKSVGVRATEAKHINQSLTTLGMCVNARADPNSTHVPFRDSKLTRLLQESLGGNAKTAMIIAVSDVLEHADETVQSLMFGSRAILVKQTARVNQYIDLTLLNDQIAAQLQGVDPETAVERALLDREDECARLRAALDHERQDRARGEEDARSRAERLQRDVERLQRDADRTGAERDAARAAHDALASEFDHVVRASRADELRAAEALKAVRMEAKALEQVVTAKDAQLEEARQQAAQAQAQLREREAEYQRQLSELRASHEGELRQHLDAAELDKAATVREWSRRLTTASSTHAQDLAALGDQHSEAMAAMEERLNDGRAQAASLRSLLSEREEGERAALDQRRRTADDLTSASALCEDLRATVAAQAAEIEAQTVQMEAQAAQIEDQAARIQGQDARIEGQAAEIEAQAAEIEARDARIEALRRESDDRAAQIKALAARVGELEVLLAAARAEAQALSVELAATKEYAARTQRELSAEVEELQSRHGSAIEAQKRALAARSLVRRHEQAAIVIQRAWKRSQIRWLRSDGNAIRRNWLSLRTQLSAEKRRAVAQTGVGLVAASMQQIQTSVEAVLMEMLCSSRTLERMRKAQLAAGIITPSKGRRSTLSPPRSGGAPAFHAISSALLTPDSMPETPTSAYFPLTAATTPQRSASPPQ